MAFVDVLTPSGILRCRAAGNRPKEIESLTLRWFLAFCSHALAYAARVSSHTYRFKLYVRFLAPRFTFARSKPIERNNLPHKSTSILM